MSTASIIVTLALCATAAFAPRRWAALALLASALLLTQRQHLDVAGLNMYPIRFLELVTAVRIFARGEFKSLRLNRVDTLLLLAWFYVTVMFLLRTAAGHGTSAHISQVSTLSRVGTLVDIVLVYVAFRCLVRDAADLRWLLARFLLVLVPYCASVVVELLTGENPLAIVGGIPIVWNDGVRIRPFGTFLHPSLLGTMGASFALLYLAIAAGRSGRAWGIAGVIASSAIVVLSNAGGPATFVALGLAFWALWFVRAHMKKVQIGAALALIGLAIAMRDPIYFLPSKFSSLVGGGGWHRSYLMQQGIRHFDEWWLAGMPLDQTLHWFPYLVMGAADITNLFLWFGLDGGMLAMLLLIGFLVTAFQYAGRALEKYRGFVPPRRDDELLLWGLGVVLAGHIANFFAITYFDQTMLIWLFQVAALSALSQSVLQPISPKAEQPSDFRRPRQGPRRIVRTNGTRH